MKKEIKSAFAAIILVGGISVAASAQETQKPRSINERQQNQQERIYNGIKSGELTQRESAKLQRQQARTYLIEKRYRESGDRLTKAERARLQNRLNQQSRYIYRQKHDRQDRRKP